MRNITSHVRSPNEILSEHQKYVSYDNTHPMITRSKVGIYKSNTFIVATNLTMIEPYFVKQALDNEPWKESMQ